jgi:hypothetical protein
MSSMACWFYCACLPVFGGRQCGTNVNECANGGECVDLVYGRLHQMSSNEQYVTHNRKKLKKIINEIKSLQRKLLNCKLR